MCLSAAAPYLRHECHRKSVDTEPGCCAISRMSVCKRCFVLIQAGRCGWYPRSARRSCRKLAHIFVQIPHFFEHHPLCPLAPIHRTSPSLRRAVNASLA